MVSFIFVFTFKVIDLHKLEVDFFFIVFCLLVSAFSALMLLVEWQEGHPEWCGAGVVISLE